MSDNKKGARRVKLPDGTYAVYMGETGKNEKKPPVQKRNIQNSQNTPSPQKNHNLQNNSQNPRSSQNSQIPQSAQNLQSTPNSRNSQNSKNPPRSPMTEAERRRRQEAYRRKMAEKRAARERERKNQNPVIGFFSNIYGFIVDKFYMQRLSASIDPDSIIRGVIVGFLILFFAILQTTVFSRFPLFGAVPDLMLPLVIAIAVSEGEKWGATCGLAAALLIEGIGTVGVAFLPLLYVPVGYIVGILSTFYYKDSPAIRAIYSVISGLFKAAFTAIYVVVSYKTVVSKLVFETVVVPEYFSTLIMSVLPHGLTWLMLKPFHKSRDDRID